MPNATAQTVKPEGSRTSYSWSKLYLKADQNLNANGTAAAAVVTVNGDTNPNPRPLVVNQIIATYNAVPTAGGTLIVTDGTITLTFAIGNQTGPLWFDPPIGFTPGAAVTFTLAAGGAGIIGSIYVNCHLEGA